MAPYGAAIRRMRQPQTGVSCCDVSDCRPVEYRIMNDHYEIFVAHLTAKGDGFEGGPDEWVEVPAVVVEPPESRLPIPVACWSRSNVMHNGIYCFAPADGI